MSGAVDQRRRARAAQTPPNNTEGLVKRLRYLGGKAIFSHDRETCNEAASELAEHRLVNPHKLDAEALEGRVENLEAERDAALSRVVELEGALSKAAHKMDLGRRFIESNQVVDKDLHGLLVGARDDARAALSPNTAGSGGAEPCLDATGQGLGETSALRPPCLAQPVSSQDGGVESSKEGA